MERFLELALGYPTVIFTTLLGFVVILWATILSGGIDPEALDPDVDFDANHDIDLDADPDVDLDGNPDPDVELHGHAHGIFYSILGFLNVGSLPLTAILGVAILEGWISSMLITYFLGPTLGAILPWWVAGTIFFLLAALLGLVMTGISTRPFRGLFKTHTFKAGRRLAGKIVTITTDKVSGSFGQADLLTEGAPLNLSVRCENENGLTKGGKAVIVDYDQERNVYMVGELSAEHQAMLKNVGEDIERVKTFADDDDN